ncbi:MAG: hypothetical protein K0R54_1901 [Clostridiaceae bacterium]|jgi:hypothetical protein|nr:hypothetical protein [Clostridiaceae bacterium]
MKNIYSSFIIFVVLIFTIVFSLKYLNKTCEKFEVASKNLEDYISSEAWEDAYTASYEFLNQWQDTSKTMSIIVHHSELDPINSEAFRMIQFVKCKNKDESLASVHTIKLLIRHVMESEKINFQNIF